MCMSDVRGAWAPRLPLRRHRRRRKIRRPRRLMSPPASRKPSFTPCGSRAPRSRKPPSTPPVMRTRPTASPRPRHGSPAPPNRKPPSTPPVPRTAPGRKPSFTLRIRARPTASLCPRRRSVHRPQRRSCCRLATLAILVRSHRLPTQTNQDPCTASATLPAGCVSPEPGDRSGTNTCEPGRSALGPNRRRSSGRCKLVRGRRISQTGLDAVAQKLAERVVTTAAWNRRGIETRQ
jgi:hypothetical protein